MLMTFLMLSAISWGQEYELEVPESFNAQRFRPSIDAGSMLWTDDGNRARSLTGSGRLLFSYVNDPLVFTDFNDDRIEIISDILQMDLLAGFTVGPVRLGADIPVYLLSTGESGSETGLGDVAGDVKVSILEQERAGVNIAVGGRLGLNTATTLAPLGAGGTSWEAQLIAERSFGAAQVALNVGNQGVPSEDLEALAWNDQFFIRAGTAYTLSDTTGASFEIAGNIPYEGVGTSGAVPFEGLVGGWFRPGARDVVVRLGLGTGLSAGVGAPRFRGLLAIAYEPPTGADVDRDGVVDAIDACPTRPEDEDGDRDRDGCPDDTAVTFRFIDRVTGQRLPDVSYVVDGRPYSPDEQVAELSSGAHAIEVSASNYRVLRTDINVPGGARQTLTLSLEALAPAKLRLRILDGNGAPIPGANWEVDAVSQGELDINGVQLDLPPMTYKVAGSAPGYLKRSELLQLQPGEERLVELALKATTIEVSEERITLNQKIPFTNRAATIQDEGLPLMDDLVTVLQEYPEIRKLRIEGHTDSRGDAAANLDLSEQRAQAVMEYLISKGIEPTRLRSEGYGESRPIDNRASLSAYERNRRIELMVEEWKPQVERVRRETGSPILRPADNE